MQTQALLVVAPASQPTLYRRMQGGTSRLMKALHGRTS